VRLDQLLANRFIPATNAKSRLIILNAINSTRLIRLTKRY
jgi:hypothetical protein